MWPPSGPRCVPAQAPARPRGSFLTRSVRPSRVRAHLSRCPASVSQAGTNVGRTPNRRSCVDDQRERQSSLRVFPTLRGGVQGALSTLPPHGGLADFSRGFCWTSTHQERPIQGLRKSGTTYQPQGLARRSRAGFGHPDFAAAASAVGGPALRAGARDVDDEEVALGRVKKIVTYFTKGLPWGAKLRSALHRCHSVGETRHILDVYFEGLRKREIRDAFSRLHGDE